MKIVQVLPALTKGGAEKVAVDLANGLVASGDEVAMVVAYPVDPELQQRALDPRVDLHFIRTSRSRFGAYASMLPWLAKNRRWIAGFDIVHCHLTFGSAFGAALSGLRRAGGKTRPKIVETYHTVGTPIGVAERRLHMALSATHDGLVTMAMDGPWRRFLANHPELCSTLIPNGISLPIEMPAAAETQAYRRRCGIPDKAKVVGTVGRLVEGRKPADLIAIFGQIAKVMPGVHFMMAGDGPERERVEALARSLGLAERVHFPGLTVRPALPFSIIDVYISLNVGAITGIAALEAAAARVPIVALQLNPDHRAGPDDWIFSSRSKDEVASEAVRLLRSPKARSVLAGHQQAHVRSRHSRDAMTEAYKAFYRRVFAR